ncbi:butyrophilin-like protein 2 [Sorex fumeus]|uniref:butyrophilin-like protein 2 n=1 Tax=Sorex fumeus TaxID=62283 RepID=UPI0024ADD9DF|nr:butyrophilin-like protein 2 [Sorex fumeus]
MANIPGYSLCGAVASLLFVLLSMKYSDDFRVIGTSPIVAMVGEDALLTCQLLPKKTVMPTKVTWYRMDPSTPVFTLLDGSEVTEKQLEEYRGRVEWIDDNIAEGQVMLKIHNIQTSDDGQYWCRFQEGDYYVETSLYLKVANLGSAPSIHIAGSMESEVQLLCTAKGWFPEPRIYWEAITGEKLLTFSEWIIQEEDGLFYVEATHVVRNACPETVSCFIHNHVLSEQKDVTISIPEKLQTELASLKVIGPSQPILVRYGEDVDLTCSLSPKVSAQDMEVRWVKDHHYPAVYVYMNGDHVAGEQMEEYRGRTTLVSDSINEGAVTLQIHNARTSDDGQYQCLFEKDGVYQEARLNLKIVGMGSSPVITMEKVKDGEVQLMCTSDGWFPQPLVQWKDVEGKTIPSFSEILTEGSHGLFQVETHLLITNSSVVNVTCSISNPLLSEEKMTNFSFPVNVTQDLHTAHYEENKPMCSSCKNKYLTAGSNPGARKHFEE